MGVTLEASVCHRLVNMNFTHRPMRGRFGRLAAVVAALLVSLSLLVACTPAKDRATERVQVVVESLDLESVAAIAADGWTSEGVGGALVHYRAVFSDPNDVDRLIAVLNDAGFEPASSPEDNPEVSWTLEDDEGNLGARLRLLSDGDSVNLGDKELYTVVGDAVAIDIFTAG
jgi:hypothetical protein